MNDSEKNVLITGASGLIGKKLTVVFRNNGYKVRHLTCNKQKVQSSTNHFYWNINEDYIDPIAFKNIDYLVNLSGASIVGKRWTKKRKELIYNSRVVGSRLLFDTLSKHKQSLKGYFGASAVGYYGNNESGVANVESDNNGTDFLSKVCFDWEKEHNKFESISKTVSIGRIANVVSIQGGLSTPFMVFSKFGIQLTFAEYTQNTAWISLDDVTKAIFLMLTDQIEGTFNLSADVMAWGKFQKEIYSSLGKQWVSIRIPPYLLRISMGEMSKLMLDSCNVSNAKLLKTSASPTVSGVQSAMR